MTRRVHLGILVPSSNTALEPLTHAIISSIQDPNVKISVHFSRFRVTQISLSSDAHKQFDLETIVAAAKLLGDAKVDVIGWSGTSAGWLGFDTDEVLCAKVEKETGIKATTSTLALNKLLQKFDVKELALVTPYVAEMNVAIRANYGAIGINIPEALDKYLGITDNNTIVQVTENTLDGMVADVVTAGARAVTTFCTNLLAAQRADFWEKTKDIIVFDTVATVVWDMLRIAEVDTRLVKGWGKMFDAS